MNENLNAVGFEAGGKFWELRLTHSVLKRVASRTRMPMSRFDELFDRYDLMTVVMEEMLRRCEPMLSEKQLCDILDEIPPMQVARLVNAAVAAAFPQEETETENACADEEGETGPFGTGTTA